MFGLDCETTISGSPANELGTVKSILQAVHRMGESAGPGAKREGKRGSRLQILESKEPLLPTSDLNEDFFVRSCAFVATTAITRERSRWP